MQVTNIGQHLSFIIAVKAQQRLWAKVAAAGAVLGVLALVSLFFPLAVVSVSLGMVAAVVMVFSGARLTRLHQFRMKARSYLAANAPLTA